MAESNVIRAYTGIIIPPSQGIHFLFPDLSEAEKKLLIEILEISNEIAARGTNIKPDGSIDTTIKRHQEVRLGQDQRINEATTENSLRLDTTQWSNRNGLWAVQRESEAIDISSQQFNANQGVARRDRFSVARVTTTGRDVPYLGFVVGSMRRMISESMPVNTTDIETQTDSGPAGLEVESFDGQNLFMLLERFRERLRATL